MSDWKVLYRDDLDRDFSGTGDGAGLAWAGMPKRR